MATPCPPPPSPVAPACAWAPIDRRRAATSATTPPGCKCGDLIARVGADGEGHRQQIADDRLDAPALRVLPQVQQFEADQDVAAR